MRASKIFLLLGILGVGGSLETAWQVRSHFGIGPLGWIVLGGRFHGPHHDYESTETREVPAGTSIAVDNAFGLVDVKPGEPGRVSVTLKKVVYLTNETKARELADKLKIQATMEGERLRITTNRQELDGSGQPLGLSSREDGDGGGLHFGWDSEVGFETHLTVRVPPDSALVVKNAHGRVDVAEVASATIDSSYDDVRVDRVKGAASVTLRHGDLDVSELGGDAELSVRYGDLKLTDAAGRAKVSQEHGDVTAARCGALAIEIEYGDVVAEGVKGALEVRGQHAAVRASDVSGNADVTTSYEDVNLKNVGGDVRAKAEHGELIASGVKGALSAAASFNDVRLEDVSGPVEATVEHGGLHARRLLGGAQVKSEGDEIVLDGFKGAVSAEARRGGVRLVPDGPISDAITASASFGDLRLEVPEGSRFELAANAEQGEVSVALAGLTVTESGKRRMAGKLGEGGALVKLATSHGDVDVSGRDAQAANR